MSKYDLAVTASTNTSESCHNNGIFVWRDGGSSGSSAQINKNIGSAVSADVKRDTRIRSNSTSVRKHQDHNLCWKSGSIGDYRALILQVFVLAKPHISHFYFTLL